MFSELVLSIVHPVSVIFKPDERIEQESDYCQHHSDFADRGLWQVDRLPRS
jgi:hypothetical protein